MPNFFAASIAIGVQSPDVVVLVVDIVILENALLVLWRSMQESVASINLLRMIRFDSIRLVAVVLQGRANGGV